MSWNQVGMCVLIFLAIAASSAIGQFQISQRIAESLTQERLPGKNPNTVLQFGASLELNGIRFHATEIPVCGCGCKQTNCDCPKDEVFGQTYDESCPELRK